MILELLAEFDLFLARHFERFGNQGSGSTKTYNVCMMLQEMHVRHNAAKN